MGFWSIPALSFIDEHCKNCQKSHYNKQNKEGDEFTKRLQKYCRQAKDSGNKIQNQDSLLLTVTDIKQPEM